MSIKSKQLIKKTQIKNYPVLMKHKKTGLIVLFINNSSGTVVCRTINETTHKIGDFTSFDIDDFEKFHGTIELSNE